VRRRKKLSGRKFGNSLLLFREVNKIATKEGVERGKAFGTQDGERGGF
jgi:hypothetical protein